MLDTNPACSYALIEAPEEPLISSFLVSGADPNVRCEMDVTPLSMGVAYAPLAIVRQLFAHCPPGTSFRGQLLNWAARRTSSDAEEVVQLVLDRCRPDLNKTQYEDDRFSYYLHRVLGLGTALHDAARSGQTGIVRMLLQKGTDASIRDSMGQTALDVAESNGNEAAAALLRAPEKLTGAKM